MKTHLLAACIAATVSVGLTGFSYGQTVIYGNGSSDYSDDPGQVESNFLQQWNRRHEERSQWGFNPDNYGPEDVIRLLERRGYRVNRVDDVGPRYLVRAWRDGDDLLVSVSRRGEIMGVVHGLN